MVVKCGQNVLERSKAWPLLQDFREAAGVDSSNSNTAVINIILAIVDWNYLCTRHCVVVLHG